MRIQGLALNIFVLFGFAILFGSQPLTAAQVGEAAPDFTIKASDGQTYTLSDFKGQSAVVIAFFPKAFTGG